MNKNLLKAILFSITLPFVANVFAQQEKAEQGNFQRTNKGLSISLPKDNKPNETSFVLKITNSF